MRSVISVVRRNWHLPARLPVVLASGIVVFALIPQGPARAQHLPTGGTVVTPGTTIVQPNSTTLNINQTTNQAIINWNTFSVGRGDTVNFNQPSSSSSTLNRVTGSAPSWIAGTINAPGTVLLINPNGIEITKSGVVNTGSFAASTLNISDSDYLSGNYRFSGNGGSAAVINNGRINTADGGFVALLGGQVSNNGIIAARLGFVALGAGEQATLDLSGDGFLSVAVPSSQLGNLVNANGALVSNKGKIIANGGTVFLSAATAANILRNAVNIPGSVRVNTVGTHNGKIVINGGGGRVRITGRLAANGGRHHSGGSIAVTGNTIDASGKLSASGANGGTISLIASNALALTGTLMAQGYGGQGGTVALTANTVTLTGATVNASGTTGGGTVDIGGGPHATVPLADAQSLLIDATSVITANATDNGNGGHIVVWSGGLTTSLGAFSAMGGPNGGNGGLIETSGETLNTNGITVTAAAPEGATGTWLLDPVDLIIDAALAGEIDASLSGGTSVTLQTSGTSSPTTTPSYTLTAGETNSSGNGDIDIESALSWSTNATLTLSAYNSINVYQNITISGAGTLVLTTNNQVGGANTAGGLYFWQGASTSYTSASQNGKLTINGHNYTLLYALANPGSTGPDTGTNDIAGIDHAGDGGYYALATSLNGSGTTFTSDALAGAKGSAFEGKFEGLGNTISNLTINNTGAFPYTGLIGYISTGGTVENLILSNISITAGAQGYAGGLSGRVEGTGTLISNVQVSGAVAGGNQGLGGLVGELTTPASIIYSSSSASVTGTAGVYYTGGLVGQSTGNISLSYATGAVQGTYYVGGLIGDQVGG
ncbi:MAG TPA: filamentous hemagglutinin N-terminal domain-containing protein, partial [Xanthobacteraceae bacterium]|nr:filamentous hemagglutinin N-terminal domain-containing protein [Xanthobacteraceae bacterium]